MSTRGPKVTAASNNIRVEDLIAEARLEAFEEARNVAALYSIKKRSIHPDIPWDNMKDSVQMVAHTTCQHVAAAIRELAEKEARG